MWLITKKSIGVLELSDDEDHYILPVFTSPDAALDFIVDIDHRGERIRLIHIDTIAQLDALVNYISERDSSAVIVDPPNPDDMTCDDDLIWWYDNEFCDILKTVIQLAETYGERQSLEVLDRYLNDKVKHSQPST